jgi:hypothetical protein
VREQIPERLSRVGAWAVLRILLRGLVLVSVSSEVLNSDHSYPVDGICVFAVKQKNVEADRKGQCGQQQAHHFARMGLGDLKCAYPDRSNFLYPGV